MQMIWRWRLMRRVRRRWGRFSYRLVELYAAGVMISELVYSRTQVEIVGCPLASHTRKRGERHVPWQVPSS
jgi:hypothetical protein